LTRWQFPRMIRIIKEARDSRGVTDGSHELSELGRSAAARRQSLVSSIAFPTIFVFSAFFEVADLTAENARIAKNLFASWRLCVFALHPGW
jgi:hypothetical protein